MAKHPALNAAVVAGVSAGVLLWLSRRYIPVKVAGPSMLPTLRPGDRLVVDPKAAPRPGDVVVVRRTDGLEIVKRVRSITEAGVELAGDNPEASTDSRMTGPVPPEQVIGVAKAIYWPTPRSIP